jgi:hypothetical protein
MKMAAAMVGQCASLHAVGIVSSCPNSTFFDTTAVMHHALMMYLPGGRGSTTNLAWTLWSQRHPMLATMVGGCVFKR